MTAFYGGSSYKRKENEEKNIELMGKALELGIIILCIIITINDHHHYHHYHHYHHKHHHHHHNHQYHHHYLHYHHYHHHHHHCHLGINFLDTAWIYQSWGVDGEENYTNCLLYTSDAADE